MPYITQKERHKWDELTQAMHKAFDVDIVTPGSLNYLITKMCHLYLRRHFTYTTINDCIGALECAKLELYRRKVAPYEDTKMKENGDVYPL